MINIFIEIVIGKDCFLQNFYYRMYMVLTKEVKMEGQVIVLPKFVQDVLSAVTTEAASSIISKWHKNKTAEMREVLLAEVRQGDLDSIHKDELLSMLARFYRSVSEGVAKSKLKLLARLIVGIGRKDKKHAKAETFYDYADLLEQLTEEEIEFLAGCIASGKIEGDEEIMHALQYKGILTSETKNELTTKKGAIIRTGPPIPNTARTLAEEQATVPQAAPYDLKTVTNYNFSKRFQKLLKQYGNLWEYKDCFAGG